jgi:mitochondrial fission protein ELM1
LVISGTGEETTSDIADLRAVFEDRLLNIYLASILPDDVHPRLFEYDLIASPQLTGANIVTTIGVPHKVTRSALTTALRQHAGFFARLPRPLIALLVGGNTRYCQGFDEAHAIALARRVSRIAKSVGGSVLVSNSRRTPENALSALLGQLTDLNPVFCDWQQTGQDFYHALLAHCDVFIATGDSLSMCSEVAYTGRPLLIDLSDDATEIYHRNIVGKLLDYGAARLLTERFEPWTYLPPDPTGAVAEAVSIRLTQKLTL